LVTALIATGGPAVAALGMLKDWGLKESQIKIISVLGSRQGVENVMKEFPGVDVSLPVTQLCRLWFKLGNY
jgi:uracil phosphoribosyltransferase